MWAMHVAARRRARRGHEAAREAGVPALAVKGVVTAYSLYREPTERPIGDVDIRIRPEDFRRRRTRSRKRVARRGLEAGLRGVCGRARRGVRWMSSR